MTPDFSSAAAPFLIAGPCALESRDIAMRTANILKQFARRDNFR